MSNTATVPHDRQQLVLNAATSVFLAHGFSAATTDMIQRQAGVSKTTLYACFPSKEAMFMAVIADQCAIMASTLQATLPAQGDIARTLTDIGKAHLTVALSETGIALFRVVIAEATRFPDAARHFYQTGPKGAISMVAERLSEASRNGEIDIHTIGADAAASLFIGMVRSEGQLECLLHPEARPSSEQINRWVKTAVDVFVGRFGKTDHPSQFGGNNGR